jgi:hypothetical protein
MINNSSDDLAIESVHHSPHSPRLPTLLSVPFPAFRRPPTLSTFSILSVVSSGIAFYALCTVHIISSDALGLVLFGSLPSLFPTFRPYFSSYPTLLSSGPCPVVPRRSSHPS